METLVIVCFSIIFGLLGFLAFLLFRARNSPDEEIMLLSASDESSTLNKQPTTSRSNNSNQNELRIGTKVIKSRNSKAPAKRNANRQLDDNEDLNNDNLNENQAAPTTTSVNVSEGRIGKKKLQKLEMKAEKKAAREQEVQLREERRLQKEKEDELQRQLEEEREQKEKEKEEEEKRLIAEQKQKEYEEYLKAKKSFVVEEEGFDTNVDTESRNKLADFINYIKEKKIVMLEELAGEFKMKTQDVITRIHELLNDEQIEGVIDDRGKFIHITQDELDSVAKFIRQNGRVSITDLVENSNRLIQLQIKK